MRAKASVTGWIGLSVASDRAKSACSPKPEIRTLGNAAEGAPDPDAG